jgi:hypothetical protein
MRTVPDDFPPHFPDHGPSNVVSVAETGSATSAEINAVTRTRRDIIECLIVLEGRNQPSAFMRVLVIQT